ncbi:MAG: hypothetical protein JEZ02_16105 [Desulfatibacillum sp.]|nr:hypothetical protein [Desulfatibacillum sp.]
MGILSHQQGYIQIKMEFIMYHIPDEPSPGTLQQWVVNPIWPLVSYIIIGPLMAFLWLLFNAGAMGVLNRKQAINLGGLSFLLLIVAIVLTIAVSCVFGFANYETFSGLIMDAGGVAVAYFLYKIQMPYFRVYSSMDYPVWNGMVLMGAAFLLRPLLILAQMFFLYIIL